MDALQIAGVTGLAVAWSASIYFLVYYHFTSRWSDNYMGKYVMAYSVALFLALTNSGARVIWPDLQGRKHASVVVVWLIAGVVIWRIIAFKRARREGRQVTPRRTAMTDDQSSKASRLRQERPEVSQSDDVDNQL